MFFVHANDISPCFSFTQMKCSCKIALGDLTCPWPYRRWRARRRTSIPARSRFQTPVFSGAIVGFTRIRESMAHGTHRFEGGGPHQVDLTALVAGAEERMGAGLGAPVDCGQGRRLRCGPQWRGGRTSMAAARRLRWRIEGVRTGRRRRTPGRAPDRRGGGGGLGGTRRGGGLGVGRTGWLRILGSRWRRRLLRGPQRRGGRTSLAAAPMADRWVAHGAGAADCG
jgi:hypothetical protein